ncbi:hypothetical protein N0V86_007374 [Didymella sp. IMI 355093]|nr:hypothetical protein N0V86_007374 [Didymella sp. IMI 355093]
MSFDAAECISLHNTIVARAIAQLPAELQPSVVRNWFTAYNVDVLDPGLPIELTEPLKEFLSGIDIVKPRGQARRIAFTPFLVGISSPEDMVPDLWEMFPGYGQFLKLYTNNGEDPGGLVMYLDEHTVAFLETCEDEPHEIGYGSFEGALRRYLAYIDAGKFVVDTSYELGDYGDGSAIEGWRYQGYLPLEMEATLNIWNQLVDTIASKMPGSLMAESNESMIPLSVLDRYPAIPLFAREFLSRAKAPPFKTIAPKLQVPDEDFIDRVGTQLDQLYEPATDPSQIRIPTANFLLFPWTSSGVPFASRDDEDRWVLNRRLLDNRAGLYTAPDGIMTNGVSMLLPFPIGSNGHVLRADGTKIDKPCHDSLYDHGVCDTNMPAHRTSLEAVLASWGAMIVNGDWKVDANGVAGGEEMWRMADTEEHAELFQVEMLCNPPERDHDEEQGGGEGEESHNDSGDEAVGAEDCEEGDGEQDMPGVRKRKRDDSV